MKNLLSLTLIGLFLELGCSLSQKLEPDPRAAKMWGSNLAAAQARAGGLLREPSEGSEEVRQGPGLCHRFTAAQIVSKESHPSDVRRFSHSTNTTRRNLDKEKNPGSGPRLPVQVAELGDLGRSITPGGNASITPWLYRKGASLSALCDALTIHWE